ncbi:MAG: protein kinase [Elusimicrobia bacterium]|nr:protein kinase [Elusimicrobiota bacterium]
MRLLLLVLLGLAVRVDAGQVEDAQAAYAAGDLARAGELFRGAAEAGDPVAQYNLGVLYEDGKGVGKDFAAAAAWYRKSADQGYAAAQNNLANLCTFGLGVPLDVAEAVKWLTKAAEQGEPGAQFNLGIMYTLGQGVAKDYGQAHRWLTKAAEQGEVEAQHNLGVMHERGDGVPADPIEAYAWYFLASGQGFQPSIEKKVKLAQSLTPEQVVQAEERAAGLIPVPAAEVPAAEAPSGGEGAGPMTPALRSLLARLSGLAAGLAGLWMLVRWFRSRGRSPMAGVGGGGRAVVAAGKGFAPIHHENLLLVARDPEECAKIARYYTAAGKGPDFVAQNQGRPPEFYGAYSRAFLAAGEFETALALLELKEAPESLDMSLSWTLKKALSERAGRGPSSGAWSWSARLGVAVELSMQHLFSEALGLVDEEILKEAAARPADADRVAALYHAADKSGEFIAKKALGRSPELLKAYAAAFRNVGNPGAADKLSGARPPEAPAASKTVVGQKYELVSQIGQGGMGLVFKAYDRALDRAVAVKKLRPEVQNAAGGRDCMLAEALTISQLSHPFIVAIHDIVQEGGNVYLVLEYVDGMPLSLFIKKKARLTLGECRKVFAYVCQAVEFAHAKKITHRDLKPANIMIEHSGFVKVMDFGLARIAKDSVSKESNKDCSGTPAYMAPEQHLGKADPRSDIFALGVCLYEMLTGEVPFRGPDFLVQKERRLYVPPTQAVRGLTADMDRFMAAALAPDPKARIQDARSFLEALSVVK